MAAALDPFSSGVQGFSSAFRGPALAVLRLGGAASTPSLTSGFGLGIPVPLGHPVYFQKKSPVWPEDTPSEEPQVDSDPKPRV